MKKGRLETEEGTPKGGRARISFVMTLWLEPAETAEAPQWRWRITMRYHSNGNLGGGGSWWGFRRAPLLLWPLSVTLLSIGIAGNSPYGYGQSHIAEGESTFSSVCAACHTIGQGRTVGPDLAGVTERREESWLQRKIKEPDRLMAEGDPISAQLVQEYSIPMPPPGLTDTQVAGVIAYLESVGEAE